MSAASSAEALVTSQRKMLLTKKKTATYRTAVKKLKDQTTDRKLRIVFPVRFAKPTSGGHKVFKSAMDNKGKAHVPRSTVIIDERERISFGIELLVIIVSFAGPAEIALRAASRCWLFGYTQSMCTLDGLRIALCHLTQFWPQPVGLEGWSPLY